MLFIIPYQKGGAENPEAPPPLGTPQFLSLIHSTQTVPSASGQSGVASVIMYDNVQ